MGNFKAGEKVVCVSPGYGIGLLKGKIYTVVESDLDVQGEKCVMLLEAIPPEPFHNYLSYRFRKTKPEDEEKKFFECSISLN
jgi:hypothetical protein